MLSNRHSEAVQNIIRLFKESGYNVTLTLVNAKDYGVAEERKRVFYIGFRKDLNIDFKFPVGSTADDKKKNYSQGYYMGFAGNRSTCRRKKSP